MRHVLVASMGLSPPILTETLWAMLNPGPTPAEGFAPEPRPRRERIVPSVVHVVTTAQYDPERGYERFDQTRALIRDKVAELFAAHELEPPELVIEPVANPRGGERRYIEDVSTEEENVLFGNRITAVIKGYCDDPATTTHVSLAGGRKSMSSFAHTALMFFGRPQDSLSHTLVHPQILESARRTFWWPGQTEPIALCYIGGDPNDPASYVEQSTSTDDCFVKLVPLPFARLHVRLPDEDAEPQLIDYARVVEYAELERNGDRVVIDLAKRRVSVGQWQRVLSPTPFALLALLALARHQRWPGPLPDRPGWIRQSDFGVGLKRNATEAKDTPALLALEALMEQVTPTPDLPDPDRRTLVDIVNKTAEGTPSAAASHLTRAGEALMEDGPVPDAVVLVRPDHVQKYISGKRTSVRGLHIDPDRLELRNFPNEILRIHDEWTAKNAGKQEA